MTVPLTAVALNLLSVAAAYGALVLVFQHSWAQLLLHFHSNGTITSWLPLFPFVILFGLSMDYHVFMAGAPNQVVRARRSPFGCGASWAAAQATYPSGRISRTAAGGLGDRAVTMSTRSFQP